jgi:2-amino-4-hydroxy-6-hydroxymethyldihydropteridine diphosphokinase
MTRVYISVGSNQQPRQNVRRALDYLQQRFAPLVISPVYESVAVGFDGDNFLNLVVAFDTELSLSELDAELDRIEQECGRVRSAQRFTSRTMDLDLLLYGALVRHDDEWDLPRQEIASYAFVLKPLADIAPQLQHPETGISFSRMWQEGDFDSQSLWRVDLH